MVASTPASAPPAVQPAPLAPAPALTLPGLKIATVSEQAVDEAIRAVREGYSNQVGLKLSTANRGTARISGDVHRGQMAAAGYIGASRQGLEAGVEVTFDLQKR